MIWFQFVLCLAIILFAGTRLARYGDIIADESRLGRIWIGVVLIAFITTMPELVTGVSSVALVGSPDLALGVVLGSCCFNLLIVALLDIRHTRTPVLTMASPRHALTIRWGTMLIAIAGAGIAFGGVAIPSIPGWLGIPSILILALYLLGMWWIFRRERSHRSDAAPPVSAAPDSLSMRAVGIRFAVAAAAVIAAGIWLSYIGDGISETTGWGGTFVGALFLAITTSAPELVIAFTALRIGAVDLAVAGLLGANMLNMAILVPIDLAHGAGCVLAAVSSSQLIIAGVAITMSLVVIAGLRFGRSRKLLRIASWYAPVLIAFYIVGAYALFASISGMW